MPREPLPRSGPRAGDVAEGGDLVNGRHAAGLAALLALSGCTTDGGGQPACTGRGGIGVHCREPA